jgi:hypothetical protein
MVFQNYCALQYGAVYGPVSLTLVCRFWHAIVTACPVLWTAIEFKQCIRHYCSYGINERPISCRNWSNLERALTRTGTATLTLAFHLCDTLYYYNEEERVRRLLDRCRDLHIIWSNVDGFTFASSISMPHLEHIELDIDEHTHIEPFIDSIERRSPLLRSLSISGVFPTNLAQHKSLLRRIVHLYLYGTGFDDIFFQRLQNLEELQ